MVAARKRENQNRINYKIYLFRYSKENITIARKAFMSDVCPSCDLSCGEF